MRETEDWLARLAERQRGPHRHRQPVAVIGPGDAGAELCEAAYDLAHALGGAGLAVVCGGRGGVMEAAARGAAEAGAIAIGLMPEDDARAANRWLSVVVPTGMGEMRNALIARSAVCLVAIGGGMGTLSEMALGLKWQKPVFVLHGDTVLPGASPVASVEELIRTVARCLAEWPVGAGAPPG